MSMITELVNKLKDLYVDPELDMLCGVDGECRQAIKESAQVIEELSAKLQSANMERSSQYYNGGWIPCSERLPEEGEPILFSTKTGGVYEGAYFDLCDNRQWYVYRDENYAWNNVITAWMPLPQPYKESDNNDMS